MPECHKCKLDGAGSKQCLECRGPGQLSNHGRTHVSINAGCGGQTFAEVEASLAVVPQDEPPFDPMLDIGRRVMAEIMALTADQFVLLQHITRGGNVPQYAREHGLSVSGAKGRVDAMRAARPCINAMMGGECDDA